MERAEREAGYKRESRVRYKSGKGGGAGRAREPAAGRPNAGVAAGDETRGAGTTTTRGRERRAVRRDARTVAWSPSSTPNPIAVSPAGVSTWRRQTWRRRRERGSTRTTSGQTTTTKTTTRAGEENDRGRGGRGARGHRRRLRKSTPRHLTRQISARRVCVFSSDPLRASGGRRRRSWSKARAAGGLAGSARMEEPEEMEPEELIAMANRERWVGMTEWRVDAFSTLHQRGKKHYSDVFRVGDCPWRLSLYPRGNAAVGPKNRDQVALYLEAADAGSAPEGWRRHVDFKLEICHEVRANPATPRATAETADDTRHNPRVSRAAPRAEISRARAPPVVPIDHTAYGASHRTDPVPRRHPGSLRKTSTHPDPPRRRTHATTPPSPGRQSRLPAPRVARSTLTSSTPSLTRPIPRIPRFLVPSQDPSRSVWRSATHEFNSGTSDGTWGFSQFSTHRRLESDPGFLVDGAATVRGYVRVNWRLDAGTEDPAGFTRTILLGPRDFVETGLRLPEATKNFSSTSSWRRRTNPRRARPRPRERFRRGRPILQRGRRRRRGRARRVRPPRFQGAPRGYSRRGSRAHAAGGFVDGSSVVSPSRGPPRRHRALADAEPLVRIRVRRAPSRRSSRGDGV